MMRLLLTPISLLVVSLGCYGWSVSARCYFMTRSSVLFGSDALLEQIEATGNALKGMIDFNWLTLCPFSRCSFNT
jgi:hypothetical protein